MLNSFLSYHTQGSLKTIGIHNNARDYTQYNIFSYHKKKPMTISIFSYFAKQCLLFACSKKKILQSKLLTWKMH